MFLTEKLSAEIREMLAPDKEPGNQNPGRPWWDAARVLLDEVDRLKPLAQVGAAILKLPEQDWHREAEGGPCLVVAYAMNEDFDYDNKPRLLGWGVTDIYYEDCAEELCDWKSTVQEALVDAGMMKGGEDGKG